jgi:hypothetical protein
MDGEQSPRHPGDSADSQVVLRGEVETQLPHFAG